MTLAEAAAEFRAATQAHTEINHDCDACVQHLDELQQAAHAAYERVKAARRQLLDLAEGKAA